MAGDLHALAVRKEIQDRRDASCVIVETDRLAGSGRLSWSNAQGFGAMLPTDDGGSVDVSSVDVVWWRRVNAPPQMPPGVTDDVYCQLITNDGRAALLGVLLDQFAGRWVSDPFATQRAENKLIQLRAAEACGLRVPRTLVSQDPGEIRRFCKALSNQVVVKSVRGTYARPPLTTLLDERLLDADEAMALSPAIYQEYVPGRRHLRVHLFGRKVYAAALESDAVDWRPDMNIPVRPAQLSQDIEERLRRTLERLGIAMGVIDLKVAPDGEPVWLEVNPQGQFLFIEGFTGQPLIGAMADFLTCEATKRPAYGERHSGPGNMAWARSDLAGPGPV